MAAAQGDADSQCNLGYCLLKGRGVKEDAQQAVKWFREAAELGHAEAQLGLSHCFVFGLGVSKNKTEAYAWCSLAAENGSTQAAQIRGLLDKELSTQALEQAQARARKLHEEIQARKEKN